MYDPNLNYEIFLSVAHCSSLNVEKRHTASPSVIVIGSGFAGIAAARALHDASFQVLINNEIYNLYIYGKFPIHTKFTDIAI